MRVFLATALAPALALPLLAAAKPGPAEPSAFKDPKAALLMAVENARSIEGKDSRMLAEYGRAYLAAGDRAKAEEAFAAAVKSDAKDGETYRLIGYAWLRAGFKSEALKVFAQMQAMDPKAKNAFTKAAICLLDAGEAAAADALMEKAWTLDKGDWENVAEYGRACVRAKRFDAAATWFSRATQAAPKEERMWNEIALAYADQGTPARTSF